MHPMLNIAVRAVRKSSNFIVKHYEVQSNIVDINSNVSIDYISKIRKTAKSIIIDTIRKFYPQHVFLTEETEEYQEISKNVQWIVYPLNSVTNFIKRFPHFAISIAFCERGRAEVAVIYDPIRNELFTAVRGRGAQLNGYRLRINTLYNIKNAFLAINSVSFKKQKHHSGYVNILSKLFTFCAHFYCTGSSVLDLAYIAAGRIDGYCAIGLKPWEFIAGELLLRESGGIICDLSGGYNYKSTGDIISGNPKIVKAIVKNLHNEFSLLV